MPPHSKRLSEEGATFLSFKIVDRGVFQEENLIKELMRPREIPGCSGTRNLADNLSDLKAQIAANQKVRVFSFLLNQRSLYLSFAFFPTGNRELIYTQFIL